MYRPLPMMITKLVLGLLVFCNWMPQLTVRLYRLYVLLPVSLLCSLVPSPSSKHRQRCLVAFLCIFCRPLPLKIFEEPMTLQNKTMQNVIPSHAHKAKSADAVVCYLLCLSIQLRFALSIHKFQQVVSVDRDPSQC